MRCCSGCADAMLIPVFLAAGVRAEQARPAVRVTDYHSPALFAEGIASCVGDTKLR